MKNLLAILLTIVISCASTPEKKEEQKQEGKKKIFNKEEVCKDLKKATHVSDEVKEMLCK